MFSYMYREKFAICRQNKWIKNKLFKIVNRLWFKHSLKDALYVQSQQKVAENQYWRIYPLLVYFEYFGVLWELRGILQFDLSYSAEMYFLIFIAFLLKYSEFC